METIIECLNCGIGFVQDRAKVKKFCSKECRLKHWTNNNRDRLNAQVRAYRAKRYREEGEWRDNSPKSRALKEWMIELKSQPCMDCGQTFEICCMDFDHRIDSEKEYNIGSMFAHHYSRELIEKELDKCDLVCANCHRIRTRNKRKGNGKCKI